MSRTREEGRFLRGLRLLMLGTVSSAIWPAYLLLLAYLARQAPWSRSMSILACATLVGLSLALFLHDWVKWLARPSGWAEHHLGIPGPVDRQLGRAGRFLAAAAAVFLLPAYLIDHGLIAPDGRLLGAPAFCRFLILGFELAVWGTCVRLLSGRSALLASMAIGPARAGESEGDVGGSPVHAGLIWISRQRRAAGLLLLAAIGAVIVLDGCGYSFSARRLGIAGSQTAAAIAACVAAYRALARAIDQRVPSWTRPHRRRSWALALTSAMARRAAARSRKTGAAAEPAASHDAPDPAEAALRPEDLAAALRRLAGCAVAALGLLAVAWLWELDLAFVRFLLNQSLWSIDDQTPVTVGDLLEAGAVMLAGVLAWRYMSTVFALTLFHRMPDDPGVRFAVVTLCRYVVLAVTAFAALGAIRVDMARISVVLAALGVGLGFGLQEIVSNFVCGIILLLERPIRIGDVVTVAGTTGRVDRIHIRATTIVNGDNQSMIVPNREFITGNLVNWTLKDKILRATIRLGVAYGTDPERVVELLMSVARRDADVVISPAPAAMMEEFGESSLRFVLFAFVPEPALVGPVRHRLCSEIQRRFADEGIVIPLPARELHLSRMPDELKGSIEPHLTRVDAATTAPPEPHALRAAPSSERSP
jgi:small-conductance mechanosensitive channel